MTTITALSNTFARTLKALPWIVASWLLTQVIMTINPSVLDFIPNQIHVWILVLSVDKALAFNLLLLALKDALVFVKAKMAS